MKLFLFHVAIPRPLLHEVDHLYARVPDGATIEQAQAAITAWLPTHARRRKAADLPCRLVLVAEAPPDANPDPSQVVDLDEKGGAAVEPADATEETPSP